MVIGIRQFKVFHIHLYMYIWIFSFWERRIRVHRQHHVVSLLRMSWGGTWLQLQGLTNWPHLLSFINSASFPIIKTQTYGTLRISLWRSLCLSMTKRSQKIKKIEKTRGKKLKDTTTYHRGSASHLKHQQLCRGWWVVTAVVMGSCTDCHCLYMTRTLNVAIIQYDPHTPTRSFQHGFIPRRISFTVEHIPIGRFTGIISWADRVHSLNRTHDAPWCLSSLLVGSDKLQNQKEEEEEREWT